MGRDAELRRQAAGRRLHPSLRGDAIHRLPDGSRQAIAAFSEVLYHNPGFGTGWLSIELVSVRSPRSAIGARIRVEVVEDGVRRSIYRHVGSGGSFGANLLRQTLGLGSATAIERLEIVWPRTGLRQTFRDVPINRTIRLIEGEAAFTPVRLERLMLGGGAPGGRPHAH